MKIISRLILGLVLVMGLFFADSYALEKYGQEIVNRKITPIKDILANPKDFSGKIVTIEGKIANECSTGCWFYVKVAEGNLSIYVDIGKSNFAIPQHTGKKVLVEGVVVLEKTGPMIQGKGVEVK